MPFTTFHQGLHCWLRHRDGLPGMRYNIIYLFNYLFIHLLLLLLLFFFFFGGAGDITFDPLVYT